MGDHAVRHFRAQTDEAYEAVRSALDAAYGYPNEATKTITAIPPAIDSQHDAAGRVYLAASDAECEYQAVSGLLTQAIASGAVEEISEATYLQELPQPPVP